MFISIWITDKHPSLLDIRSKEKMRIVGTHIGGRFTKKNKAIIAAVDYLKEQFGEYVEKADQRDLRATEGLDEFKVDI